MSEVYGFSITVEGNAIKSIGAIDTQLHKLEVDSKQATSNISNHFNQMNSKLKSMFSGMGGLMAGATGLGFLFGGVSLAKSSLEAFDKREEAVAKLEAVLRSTGSAAGLTAEELEKMAGVQSGKELFSKSSIEDAESMLLTFTSIKGKVFEEAMPAIADFATRFKMDLPEAANMVGKALNDPLKGMTRLQREGVVFSDQQKEQIKNFMAVGDVASAQGIILKELGTEFGGLAEAMTTTDAGKLKMVTKELDNMKLTIGQVISKTLVGLTPAIQGIGSLFHKVFGTDMSKDMEGSRIAMNTLFKELQNSNTTLEERKGIMNTLNTEYREYLPYLLTDKTDTKDLAIALEQANNQLSKKIDIQVKLEAVESTTNEYKKVAAKWMKEQSKVDEAVFKLTGGKTPTDSFEKGMLNAMVNSNEEIRRLKKNADNALYDKLIAEKTMNDKLGILNTSNKSEVLGGSKNKDKPTNRPVTDNASNTSLLGGASGGLGEAKQIHIDFHKALLEVNVPGGNGQDIVNKAPLTVEMLLRIINNMSLSQGATM